ncbi:MAG: helix-turn-helix domain-containing protein [Planctomycetota bacterium]
MRLRPIQALILDLARSADPDDDLDQRLRHHGLRPRKLRDPRRAPQAVADGTAQVVILIVGAKSSTELGPLLERLARANGDVPVIVLSQRPSVEEAAEATRGRARDYIALNGGSANDLLDRALERVFQEKGYARTVEERFLRSVGERLRAARTEQALTLRQLAQRTGLSISLISQIELARNSASLSSLLKLSRALHLKLGDVFAGW